MQHFCPYIIIAPYDSFCQCKNTNEICPFVRRCSNEVKWKKLESMDKCLLRSEKENMFKHKIRFEKNGLLYVENNDCVVTIRNPFDEVPEGVDDIVYINNEWYIKGYEPKVIDEIIINKKDKIDKKINPK